MYAIDLKGKTAIVTGGAKGIGKAISRALADCGANVVIADFDRAEGDKAVQELGERTLAVKVDVAQKAAVEAMFAKTLQTFGRLDIMVNNAGVSTMDYVVDIKEADWDRVMEINAKGVFLCSQAAAGIMLKQGNGGKIINIASQAGKNGYRCMGNYCASKHAVLGLTKVLAVELAKDRINVNAVCPGIVETDMKRQERIWGGRLRKMSAADIQNEDRSQVPLGRTGTPQDVANIVVFLASEYSDYMTGQSLNVTGGMTMN
ncbi:MAG: SDR family NAD(P)-dependent oxidoreductase [Peptococcaceae bacterium]